MHLQLELIQDESFAKILNSGFGSEFRKIEVYGTENTGQHHNCPEICYFSAGIAQLGEQQTEASVCLYSGGPVFNPRSWHCFAMLHFFLRLQLFSLCLRKSRK